MEEKALRLPPFYLIEELVGSFCPEIVSSAATEVEGIFISVNVIDFSRY